MVCTTDQTFTCAARAHVATAERRTACLHVSRAMQAARRRSDFDFTSRLGRRAEAGPRQVLRRVGRRRSDGDAQSSLFQSLRRILRSDWLGGESRKTYAVLRAMTCSTGEK